MADRLRQIAEAIRTGYLLYRADNPVKVELTTSLPRVLLQSIFYTLLGRLAGGMAGAAYAFTGTIAFAAATSTVISVCDIPVTDQWEGTLYRLQAGTLSPGLVYLCRALPYAMTGFIGSLAVACIDAPILGLTSTMSSLPACLPLYGLTAITSTLFGLSLAAFAMGGNHDVLYGNLGSYILLATGGIIVPASRVPFWITDIGWMLPITHGLAAIRHVINGGPWLTEMALEAACGAAWLTITIAVVNMKDRHARDPRPGLAALLAGLRPSTP